MVDYAGYLIPRCKDCPYWSDGGSWDIGCTSTTKCGFLDKNDKRHLYYYHGSVKYFDTYINYTWTANTMAVSKAKAKSNLTYKYKKDHGYPPNTRITLPDEIIMIE